MSPSPYDDPDLYDALFEWLEFDRGFYLELARRHGGPLLDVGCGTGRLLLRLSRDGYPVDGWEPSRPMFDRLRAKVRAAGLSPRLFTDGVDNISGDARYGVVFCAFNAFAHNLTAEAQLGLLRRMRAATRPGGVVAIGSGHPSFTELARPSNAPVVELQTDPAISGRRLRLSDERSFDYVSQVQHSRIVVEELDAQGATLATFVSETDVRWCFQPEFELLLRLAGFGGFRIHGGYDGEVRHSDTQPMVIEAW